MVLFQRQRRRIDVLKALKQRRVSTGPVVLFFVLHQF